MSAINAGHPFREGDGRTQLAFLQLLTLNAGFAFDDEAIEADATMHAMIQSFGGNLLPLTELIARIIA